MAPARPKYRSRLNFTRLMAARRIELSLIAAIVAINFLGTSAVIIYDIFCCDCYGLWAVIIFSGLWASLTTVLLLEALINEPVETIREIITTNQKGGSDVETFKGKHI